MNNQKVLYEMEIGEQSHFFASAIDAEIHAAEEELQNLQDTIDSVKRLKPECDKLDYALAASIGAICGVFDIFLVGKPNNPIKQGEKSNSLLSDVNDKWVRDKVETFARMNGWKKDNNMSDEQAASKAIAFLEKKYKIPYDQTGVGDSGKKFVDLKPINHHFKSLAHNPSICGLFFSIVDQFTNSSHFIAETALGGLNNHALHGAGDVGELAGKTDLGKCFSAFKNWFGHLISDISGASGSTNRGMGIPSPLWTWINDIIAIKSKLQIPPSEFDKAFNELAINIYTKGYDIRFQIVQAIPVLLNECLVRFVYSIRRMISYYSFTVKEDYSFTKMLNYCNPFTNATVKRMLTVAHGTFCVLDTGNAVVKGVKSGKGSFDTIEFIMRLNVVGLGRFSISLYGEANRAMKYHVAKKDAELAERDKFIVEEYLKGLIQLSKLYDDKDLLTFVDDLKKSDMYESAFQKAIALAELRNVPSGTYPRNLSEIDAFFGRGKK